MRVKEENEKASLKLNIQETKIMASGPNTSWQTDEEKVETMEDLIFFSKITVDGGRSHDGGGGGLVTKSCLTLCDTMDCSPPGSSVHDVLQARILEWVAILFSRGSS